MGVVYAGWSQLMASTTIGIARPEVLHSEEDLPRNNSVEQLGKCPLSKGVSIAGWETQLPGGKKSVSKLLLNLGKKMQHGQIWTAPSSRGMPPVQTPLLGLPGAAEQGPQGNKSPPSTCSAWKVSPSRAFSIAGCCYCRTRVPGTEWIAPSGNNTVGNASS